MAELCAKTYYAIILVVLKLDFKLMEVKFPVGEGVKKSFLGTFPLSGGSKKVETFQTKCKNEKTFFCIVTPILSTGSNEIL